MEAENEHAFISQEEFNMRIRNKRDLFNTMCHAGFVMPVQKGSFATVKWMEEVLQGKCYCPKKYAINWKYCEFPPSQD